MRKRTPEGDHPSLWTQKQINKRRAHRKVHKLARRRNRVA